MNVTQTAVAGTIGRWGLDETGLPVFEFTAPLPLATAMPNGKDVDYPRDPWFLIGNYRFNCFVHAGGGYQLLTMERAIARLNRGEAKNSGITRAAFTIGSQTFSLTGTGSPIACDPRTQKIFGPGFGRFVYTPCDTIEITRTLATLPSAAVNQGCSAMLIEVCIRNRGDTDCTCSCSEGIDSAFSPAMRIKDVTYSAAAAVTPTSARISFLPRESQPLSVGRLRSDYAVAEGCPPDLFFQIIPMPGVSGRVSTETLSEQSVRIDGECPVTVPAGGCATIRFVVGYLQDDGALTIERMVADLTSGDPDGAVPFRRQWRTAIPAFENETSAALRTELQWHAATLESMANYSEKYGETYIPQGTVYEYIFGVSAALNDISVHSLPAVFYNPSLAKSILRYTLKHAVSFGLMFGADIGAGRIGMGSDMKSNSYPYTIFALAEYLGRHKDAAFLNETIIPFGEPGGKAYTILERIERLVLFTRDEMGTGPHGLPKLLNSDWNDCFYFFFKDISFHDIFGRAESHMNAAMLALYCAHLGQALDELTADPALAHCRDRLKNLVAATEAFGKALSRKLTDDLGNRSCLPRAYIGKKAIGENNLFLEPQIFAVAMDTIPREQRLRIWQSVASRLWQGEKKGARQNEKGYDTGHAFSPPGSRENGGFWFSLNGPLMVNLIDIDPDAARECFDRMTLLRHARDFPDYWVGMWSGPDSFDSSTLPSQGLTNPYLYPFPVYCAHAHAWVLWGYYRLKAAGIL